MSNWPESARQSLRQTRHEIDLISKGWDHWEAEYGRTSFSRDSYLKALKAQEKRLTRELARVGE